MTMKRSDIFPGWFRILQGRAPLLSIEITKECPLRCPGCYAYQPDHLGNGKELRQLSDFRGDELVGQVLALVQRLRPLHISIVGGEPLVRLRELNKLLPELDRLGIEVQLVTSAVRGIPAEWNKLGNLHLVVSIDGLQPEHDKRRFPATYQRILENIAGQQVIVHCTVTRQMLRSAPLHGPLAEFARFWSERDTVRKIWFSLYTPQEGECSEERLLPQERLAAIDELTRVREQYPKVDLPPSVLNALREPPRSPQECIFSQVTACYSADLKSRVTPCQFGGQPVCRECGCLASAGMLAVGQYRLGGIVRVADIFAASRAIGQRISVA
jgi:sulfatase maturation enzyme AslB (radical SAM superfamily)